MNLDVGKVYSFAEVREKLGIKDAPVTNELASAAIDLARQGRRVLPLWGIVDDEHGPRCECGKGRDCRTPGKHPRFSGWETAATTDETKIASWWKAYPRANPGVLTGRDGGVTVLDADDRASLEELQIKSGAAMPDTFTVNTGRPDGRHYWLAYCADIDTGNNRLGPGLDVKNDGGLVVGPGARHISGKRYTTASSCALAEMPRAWLPFAVKDQPKPERSTEARTPTEGDLAFDEFVSRLVDVEYRDERDVRAVCPVCQHHGLAVTEAGGRLLVCCHHSRCSFVDVLRAVDGVRRESTATEQAQRQDAAPVDAHDAAALDRVITAFRRWQYLPDERPLLVVLGAYIANQLDGDPVWLLVVGASGRGKTEMVSTLAGLPDVYSASTLTEASLLSGTPKREKAKEATGGLLRQIGEAGILLCKDFTSILSMHRDARAGVLAALREIYDGGYVRQVGTDGGRTLAWQGRIGFVGGVTGIIDNAHAVMSVMGERFLMVRLPEADERELSRSALAHTRNPKAMRAELAEAVVDLVQGVALDADVPDLDDDERERLIDLAGYVARARSPVIRDGYRREIELIVGAEAPTRIAIVLARLLDGIRALGADDARAWSAVYLAGLDSIPRLRRLTLDLLADGETWQTKSVATRLAHPTITVRRTLEDLAAYDLIARTSEGSGPKGDEWRMTGRCSEMRRYFPSSVSEMSGDRNSDGA